MSLGLGVANRNCRQVAPGIIATCLMSLARNLCNRVHKVCNWHRNSRRGWLPFLLRAT